MQRGVLDQAQGGLNQGVDVQHAERVEEGGGGSGWQVQGALNQVVDGWHADRGGGS